MQLRIPHLPLRVSRGKFALVFACGFLPPCETARRLRWRHPSTSGALVIKRVSILAVVLAVVFAAHSLLLAWVPQVQSGQWAPIQPDPEQAAATMLQARDGAAAVLLPNDRVLIIGGAAADGTALSSAEAFTPQGQFLSAGSMNIARKGHTATLLENGRVMVAGGITATGDATDTVEIYDMSAGTWTLAGSLQSARSGHT